MTTITKERIELFIKNPLENGLTRGEQMELARIALASLEREQMRREHAEWSDATFGDVGPIGPLKHLSKEALEAAAEPDDLSEWADMQFLLWDAQRRAGITEKQITRAMIEKLEINKSRQWPEPKDGEPRLHIKEQPAPVMPAELHPDTQNLVADFCTALAEKLYGAQLKYGYDADWKQDGWHTQCLAHFHQHIAKGDPRDVAAYCAFMWYHGWKTGSVSGPVVPDYASFEEFWSSFEHPFAEDDELKSFAVEIWNACRSAMLQAGNHTEQHLDMVDHSGDANEKGNSHAAMLKVNKNASTELPNDANLSTNSPVIPGGWISCSERMPAQDDWVLIYSKHGEYLAGQVQGEYVELNDGTLSWLGSALHWMQLPEPPQEVK
ncbi:hypothetical protein DQR98_21605 [Salmonella enterica subsp. enterica serovar Poona]|nr:hypothetical protein [Salmonella enterica subsp. enterica serovar Poona]